MAFFKELSERIGDYTLTLTITKDKGQLVVMLVPKLEAKKDDALKEIIPLTVKGTPDQLDAGFIIAISQGISLTTGLQTNIKKFEAGLKKAEKKLKGKDDKKDDIAKTQEKEGIVTGDGSGNNSGDDDDDQIPFGDDVDKETGEVKETKEPEPKKTPEPKAKSVEPKAKEPAKPKEEKVDPTKLSGELTTTDDDEWS